MAIVLGGRIINLPQEDLSGLAGGIGNLLNAIGTQRQERADRQQLSDLNRVLSGDVLGPGQQGPLRPGITDPQERFRAIMETVPQLRRPQNQKLALELAKTQAGVIPTTGAAADPIQDAILTDATGKKRKIRASLSTILRSPNLDFPEVDTGTDRKIMKDELGNLIAIDPETLKRFPISGATGQEVSGAGEVSLDRKAPPFITAEELGKSTGPLSFGANVLAASLGAVLPGEQFSSIKSAQNKVNTLNKQITQTLVLSKRFPVFELKQIKGFLVEPGKLLTDPGAAAGKILDLKDFLTVTKQGFENQLNQTISAERRREIIGKLGNINSVLGLLPDSLSLKSVSGREVTLGDINNMSLDDIRRFPRLSLRSLPKDIKREMLRRLEAGQGNTSGSF